MLIFKSYNLILCVIFAQISVIKKKYIVAWNYLDYLGSVYSIHYI